MKNHPKNLKCRVDRLTNQTADVVFENNEGQCEYCIRIPMKLAKEIKRRWDKVDTLRSYDESPYKGKNPELYSDIPIDITRKDEDND